MATWSPNDTRYQNGELIAWRDAGWRQRISLVAFWGFMGGIIGPALLIGALVVMGMMIEGIATHSEQLDRCQRQAVTPYDYHRCR